MRTLKHLVKKDGYPYITTPNLGHPKVPEYIRAVNVMPANTRATFHTKTVSILFKRYGFDIVKFYKHKKLALIFLSKKI
jgi:hypothetical protein